MAIKDSHLVVLQQHHPFPECFATYKTETLYPFNTASPFSFPEPLTTTIFFPWRLFEGQYAMCLSFTNKVKIHLLGIILGTILPGVTVRQSLWSYIFLNCISSYCYTELKKTKITRTTPPKKKKTTYECRRFLLLLFH